MSTATATRYTPEDLLALPDGKRFELVDGENAGAAMNHSVAVWAYRNEVVSNMVVKANR